VTSKPRIADPGADHQETTVTLTPTTTTTMSRRPQAAATRRTVTLSGVKPTGELHLGNYVGAIRPLARLAEDPARDVLVFVADLHALNTRPDPAVLRRSSPAASTARTSTSTARAGCPPSPSSPRC
jgi:hypothetical protein